MDFWIVGVAKSSNMIETETVASMESRGEQSQLTTAVRKRGILRRRAATMQRSTSQIALSGSLHDSSEDCVPQKPENLVFPVVLALECILLSTLLTGTLILLHGILLMLVVKFAVISFRWFIYFLNSKDTTTLLRGVTTYHKLLVREIRTILKGGKLRMAGAGAMMQYADTTQSIVTYVWRVRSRSLNAHLKAQLNHTRSTFEKYKESAV